MDPVIILDSDEDGGTPVHSRADNHEVNEFATPIHSSASIASRVRRSSRRLSLPLRSSPLVNYRQDTIVISSSSSPQKSTPLHNKEPSSPWNLSVSIDSPDVTSPVKSRSKQQDPFNDRTGKGTSKEKEGSRVFSSSRTFLKSFFDSSDLSVDGGFGSVANSENGPGNGPDDYPDPPQRSTNFKKTSLVDEISDLSSDPLTPQVRKRRGSNDAPSRKQASKKKDSDKAAARERAKKDQEWKAAVEAANKHKHDKDYTVKELILELSEGLQTSKAGEQIIGELESMGVTCNKLTQTQDNNFEVIKVRRKVTREYDEKEGMFVPVDLWIREEDHAIILISGEGFIKALETGLLQHMETIAGKFSGKRIIYLVEGLQKVLRKHANAINRQVAQRARHILSNSDGQDKDSSKSSSSSAPVPTPTVSAGEIREKAELALIELQVQGYRIIQCEKEDEVVNTTISLIRELSTAPYKKISTAGEEQIEESGIPSGKDVKDTFAKSLSQIKYVTPTIAQAIASSYSNPHHLMTSIAKHGTYALEGLRQGDGKKVIGTAMAKSITNIFTSHDPDEYEHD
uniref:ARAD1D48378p n=1 Tax=Blastobotrys adeninivorans TaxID=409370 RepID=A0A060TD58_BLAAD